MCGGTKERKVHANRVTWIYLWHIRVLVGSVPVVAGVVELRPVISKHWPLPTAMSGRQECNFSLNVLRAVHLARLWLRGGRLAVRPRGVALRGRRRDLRPVCCSGRLG